MAVYVSRWPRVTFLLWKSLQISTNANNSAYPFVINSIEYILAITLCFSYLWELTLLGNTRNIREHLQLCSIQLFLVQKPQKNATRPLNIAALLSAWITSLRTVTLLVCKHACNYDNFHGIAKNNSTLVNYHNPPSIFYVNCQESHEIRQQPCAELCQSTFVASS